MHVLFLFANMSYFCYHCCSWRTLMTKQTIKSRMATKIRRSRKEVFKRNDFKKIADYDQVGRALRELVRDNVLIKIAYGLYAKAKINRVTGKPMVAAPDGFDQVAKEALKRLKVQWESNVAEKAYSKGSSQVPASFQPVIKSRFSRKIGYGKQMLRTR